MCYNYYTCTHDWSCVTSSSTVEAQYVHKLWSVVTAMAWAPLELWPPDGGGLGKGSEYDVGGPRGEGGGGVVEEEIGRAHV